MELANANGRRGATVYEVLSHDGVQDNEYMSIGKALEGDKRKRQPDPKGSNKQSNIDKTLAEQAKYLNMLKVVSVILAISMVIATVTFGVLIHELVSSYH